MTRETDGDETWLNQIMPGDNIYAQNQAQADAVNDFIATGGLDDPTLQSAGVAAYEEIGIARARTRLICALGELPYAASGQSTVLLGSEIHEEEFLDGVTAWLAEFGLDDELVEIPSVVDIMDARRTLVGDLQTTAYSDIVLRGIDTDGNEHEFLEQVILWVNEFSEVLNGVQQTAAATQVELDKLRAQRTAIREFLGTKQRGGDGPW